MRAHADAGQLRDYDDGRSLQWGYPGKDYDIEDIPIQDARDRLDAIGLADMTKISVFRLSGVLRLYGFRRENVFHVVWWDPPHQIWPSVKKHT